MFMVSAAVVLIIFFGFGLFFSKNVSSSSDYVVASRKAGVRGVAGVILGALVGGGATVGTVQMAYQWGISGIWFTLGSGIACLVMGIWFVKPLRSVELITLPQFLGRHYGNKTAMLVAFSTASGSFLSIIAQFLSGVALIRSVFPVSAEIAAVLVGGLIIAFVFGGGIKSFSKLGEAKVIFLYLVMVLCVVLVSFNGETPWKLYESLPAEPYFNVLARGATKDLGSFASLLLGVLCGQIYIQAVYTASDDQTAKKGCFWASLLIPPLGFLCVWLGLAMRNSGIIVEASQALPFFIKTSFSPVLGGLLWSGIMITVLGTAVGVSLGVATNITRDIVLPMMRNGSKMVDRKVLQLSRITLVFVVASAGTVAYLSKGSLILQWAYLGMGIKAAGIFIVLLFAVLIPGHLPAKWSILAVLGGLSGTAFAGLFLKSVDPLFSGLIFSLIPAMIGFFAGKRNNKRYSKNSNEAFLIKRRSE